GDKTRCISCHTAVPIALAWPALGDAGEAEKNLIANVRARVDRWDKIASWDGTPGKVRPYYSGTKIKPSLATESVLNALVLVNHDVRRNGGKLGDDAKKALGLMWSTQSAAGDWDWLDFGLLPWELDAKYYGAALAAVAVGKAGKPYYTAGISPEDKKKLGKLRQYLKNGYPNRAVHHTLAPLW